MGFIKLIKIMISIRGKKEENIIMNKINVSLEVVHTHTHTNNLEKKRGVKEWYLK